MILRKRACLKSSKSHQYRGIDSQPSQIFKTMRSMFYFNLGICNSVESFQRNFIVLVRVPKNWDIFVVIATDRLIVIVVVAAIVAKSGTMS